jgi:hypothetical protein
VYWPGKRRVSVERNVVFGPVQVEIPEGTRFEGEQVCTDTTTVTPTEPSTSSEATASLPDQSDDCIQPPRRLPDGLDPPEPNTGRGFRAHRAPGEYAKLNDGKSANLAQIDFTHLDDTIPTHFALATGSNNDPRTVKEALEAHDAEQWQDAMDAEIRQLERLGTWKLVYPPTGVNVISSGFVFHRKHDYKGAVSSHKARFVGKGYSQVYGVDYFETFAPSVKMSSLRVVLSIAARNDWEIHQIDVKGAYLNATLKENIYTKPPPGYLKQDDEGKVCKLIKGIYGVKQAGREWYDELSGRFEELGFTRSRADICVFFKLGDAPIIITVSTDDMTLSAALLETILELKGNLQARYEITDLGELRWILGIKVTRNRDAWTISLSQKAYIESILNEFNLADASPLSVPAEPGAILTVEQSPQTPEEIRNMEDIPYARGVGKLMYYYVSTGPQIG